MKKYLIFKMAVISLALVIGGCAPSAKQNSESQSIEKQSVESEKTEDADDSETENPFKQMIDSRINDGTGYFLEDAPEFLSQENKDLFTNAEFVAFNFSVNAGFDLINYENGEYVDLEKDGYTYRYYKTDYNYSDFVKYIKSVFDEEESRKLINDNVSYTDINGKLYCMDAARGSDISYKGKRFELISETDDEIIFKAVAEHSWAEFYENEQQYHDEGNTDAFEWEEEYEFKIVKTNAGYRIAEFEYWK